MGLQIKATTEEIRGWLTSHDVERSLIEYGIIPEPKNVEDMAVEEMKVELAIHRQKDSERFFELNLDDIMTSYFFQLSKKERDVLVKTSIETNMSKTDLSAALLKPLSGFSMPIWVEMVKALIERTIQNDEQYIDYLSQYLRNNIRS